MERLISSARSLRETLAAQRLPLPEARCRSRQGACVYAAVLRCVLTLILLAVSESARAQSPHAGHQPLAAPSTQWSVGVDAAVFFGRNKQVRHFADYAAWESQNWFMLTGQRQAGPGRLTLTSMLSFERFTMNGQGSPQLFQTGESYKGIPLVN